MAQPWSEALVEQFPTAVMVWRLEDEADPRSLTLRFANAACWPQLGFELRPRVGERFLAIFPEATAAAAKRLARVCTERVHLDFGADGIDEPVFPGGELAFHAVPLPERSVACLFEDQAARKSAALHANHFLDAVIEHLPAVVFLKDAQRLTYVHFNRACVEFLGLSREEILGKTDADLFPKDQAEFHARMDRQALATGALVDIPEEPIRTARGEERWIHTRKLPLKDERGRPRYVLGVAIDVTELRKSTERLAESHEHLEAALSVTENQLRQSQKQEAIGRLAGGVAHDFNNLLTVILGNAALALEGAPPSQPLRGELEAVLWAGKRAAALTRQLLTFTRKQAMEISLVDVNELIVAMQELLPRLLGDDVRLEVRLSPTPSLVRADPNQLTQVVMNLVVNARDAMPEGGTLSIRTTELTLAPSEPVLDVLPPGAYVVLEVKDSGVGIDEATQRRLFEPFFTTKEKGKGTGLGLAIALGIVQQCGGTISVESQPGRGATFRVVLPRAEGVPARAAAPASQGAALGAETVLLAEEDFRVRGLMEQMLRSRGYRVLEASGAAEALAIAAAHEREIDLVITDVPSADAHGHSLARQLKVRAPNARLLLVSGLPLDLALRTITGGEAAGFLQKPFTPDELVAQVREVLRRPSPEGPRSAPMDGVPAAPAP